MKFSSLPVWLGVCMTVASVYSDDLNDAEVAGVGVTVGPIKS